MDNSRHDSKILKKRFPDEYKAIFEPVLTRRQALVYWAFRTLNREREYINTGIGLKPMVIKEREIKAYWDKMQAPIAFEILLSLVRMLDDEFIDYSLEMMTDDRT